jgi:hypothetical protein
MSVLETIVFGSQKEVRADEMPGVAAKIASLCPTMHRTTLITRNFLAPFDSQTMVRKSLIVIDLMK